MKVLIVHNFYQVAGGEDAVFESEKQLLRERSHEVYEYVVDNHHLVSTYQKIKTAIGMLFSFSEYFKFKHKLNEVKPDLVHIHNYFPLLSPAIFWACKRLNVPVVHTLHNYRAICPTALLMFDGKINEQSITKSPWWAIPEKVYRNSLVGTAMLTFMIVLHKKLGTWQKKVDRFIALTEFQKTKYVKAGWPEKKIGVKSNFITDPFDGANRIEKSGGYVIFVGRLSEEKGIDLLLKAWQEVDFPIKIVGDGPLKAFVQQHISDNVEFLGPINKPELFDLVKDAEFMIMPSTWYEGFPMVLVESFACGTPALVSRLGSMAEIVEPYQTGLQFSPGDAEDLVVKIKTMLRDKNQTREMGNNARQKYLSHYTCDENCTYLLDIYQDAIVEASQ